MPFDELPATAAWTHRGARAGFEVLTLERTREGTRLRGTTTAVEDGHAWSVTYDVQLDATWHTRRALITGADGRHRELLGDGRGSWTLDGVAAPLLDGCLDVDLESSAVTNMLPVHRLDLPVDGRAEVPAAFVRAVDLSVERLEQRYRREPDVWRQLVYAYEAPQYGVRCLLVYDAAGLLREYPGLAERTL